MIYKIRVILDSQEDIFRDLAVSPTDTLEDFHNAIAQSFGFDGAEMASFYTCDEDWNQDEEISLFDVTDGRSMGSTTINEVIDQDSPKLIYVYDFLLMWTFFVELADITPKEDGQAYPYTLFSFGELPDTPPEKVFEADSTDAMDFNSGLDDDEEYGDFNDIDYDEEWN